jgi:hypothetical protein
MISLLAFREGREAWLSENEIPELPDGDSAPKPDGAP